MQKRIIFVTILLLIFWTGFTAAAERTEKIGFVDVREIMLNSVAGKKATEDFKKMFEKNRIIIQGRESELQKLKEELEKQRSILTEAALKEKEASYQAKFREYQGLVKEANQDLQGKDQELAKSMIPEIQKLISALGEKEKYTIIFDVSAQPVPYYNKAADLTKRIMEEFNKTHKPKK